MSTRNRNSKSSKNNTRKRILNENKRKKQEEDKKREEDNLQISTSDSFTDKNEAAIKEADDSDGYSSDQVIEYADENGKKCTITWPGYKLIILPTGDFWYKQKGNNHPFGFNSKKEEDEWNKKNDEFSTPKPKPSELHTGQTPVSKVELKEN